MIVESKPKISIWYTTEDKNLSSCKGLVALSKGGQYLMIAPKRWQGIILTGAETETGIWSASDFHRLVELQVAQDHLRYDPYSIEITQTFTFQEFLSLPESLRVSIEPMRSGSETIYINYIPHNFSYTDLKWALRKMEVRDVHERLLYTADIVKRILQHWGQDLNKRPEAVTYIRNLGIDRKTFNNEQRNIRLVTFLEDYAMYKDSFLAFSQLTNFESKHIDNLFSWFSKQGYYRIGGLTVTASSSTLTVDAAGLYYTQCNSPYDDDHSKKILAFVAFYIHITGRFERFVSTSTRRALKK